MNNKHLDNIPSQCNERDALSYDNDHFKASTYDFNNFNILHHNIKDL